MKKMLSLVALMVLVLLGSSIPGSGKGPPPPDIPVRVTVAGTANSPAGYSIVSDGIGDYVDGQQGVSAVVAGNGSFAMDPTANTVTSPRALWYDFSNRIAVGTSPNPWFGQGLVKLDSQLQTNYVGTVPVGGVLESDGRFGEIYNGTGKKLSTYRVVFNPNPNGPNYQTVNYPNLTSPVVVTHPDCNTWILSPKVIDYGAGAGSGPVSSFVYFVDPPQSTGQYLMSYQLTLTRKVPITCP